MISSTPSGHHGSPRPRSALNPLRIAAIALVSLLALLLSAAVQAPGADRRISATDSVGVPGSSGTWFLAEGCTEGGFETWILVQNPGTDASHVTVTYQTEKGEVAGPDLDLAPGTRATVNVSATVRSYQVSAKVTGSRPITCERAVYFGGRKGATVSIGAADPAPRWYLAEGCAAGGFETWVLVQNPGSKTSRVALTYQTENGVVAGPVFDLAAGSRHSVNAGATVSTYQVSTTVEATEPVVAERAVYCPGRIEATDSIGVTGSAPRWFLAEGCTEGGFETWVLIQNPGEKSSRVTLTYQTGNGEVAGPVIELTPGTRQSVNVGATVASYDVSTTVSGTEPVIAERAVYCKGRSVATDSIGATAAAGRWLLAEGCTEGGFETWVLVQNPGTESSHVTLTYQTATGAVAGPAFDLAPGTRRSVNAAETVKSFQVSTEVTGSGPVVAERAMYYSPPVTVCIDPGHSANCPSSEIDAATGLDVADNEGAPGERQAIWELALKVRSRLEAMGYSVTLTKQSADAYSSLRTRADIGNSCNVIVRLHYDPDLHAVMHPVEGQYKQHGSSIVYVDPGVASASLQLAESILPHVRDAGVTRITEDMGGTSNNTGPAFVGSVLSKVPVVLIENDPAMVRDNPAGQEKVAGATAAGIASYFSVARSP